MSGAVVFDLDGTLVHSAPDIHAAVNRALAEQGQEPLSLGAVTGFIGDGVPALIAGVADDRGIAPERRETLMARYLFHYNADSVALTRPFPGLERTLSTLIGSGHRLGVCTNKPEGSARDILRLLGLDRYFEVVVGAGSLPQRKPHPAPLLHCFERLDAQGVYVGDSEVDGECAARAGVPFLLFTGGYRKRRVAEIPHREAFGRFADLPGLMAAPAA
ncbi:phosphoglycolate phosphatase [Salinihabitans flavidus]|uniref:Phosphoglycolate phosphatase n=1 Tax=Salinihabitans flavidus TaxID=569882 RepID=A0A1H8TP14_9RHOB|nr:phosphoglycolate phosphatase [Salinihabitans flavidus]SEO92780.1 phosphoglycolate phosphatase [Salinihabitans flavidus]